MCANHLHNNSDQIILGAYSASLKAQKTKVLSMFWNNTMNVSLIIAMYIHCVRQYFEIKSSQNVNMVLYLDPPINIIEYNPSLIYELAYMEIKWENRLEYKIIWNYIHKQYNIVTIHLSIVINFYEFHNMFILSH